jgi:hypothetical protein
MLETRWWHERVGQPGGSGGIDDAFLRLHDPGMGSGRRRLVREVLDEAALAQLAPILAAAPPMR